MSDQIQGTVRDIGGRMQQKVGDMVGDARTQAEGLYNQAAGQAQQQAAWLSDTIKEQPLVAAAVALGVGYLIGRLTS